MIQRIQTVYLAVATILTLSVFFTPIYSRAVNDPSAWIGNGFAVFLTLTLLLSFVAIFLYGNRQRQILVVKIATYLQAGALGFAGAIIFTVGGFGRFMMWELLSSGLLLIAFICLILANKNIKKDEEMVRSIDRIR